MRVQSASLSGVIGSGRIRVLLGTDPAPGVEIVETVPAGKRWRLIGAVFVLVTNATATLRTVTMQVRDASGVAFGLYGPTATQAASLTTVYNWADGSSSQGLAQVSIWFPHIFFLMPGYTFRTTTTNLAAGDNYGAPGYHVEEWDL